METVPGMMPAPAIVTDKAKPVIISPPEVSAAHDFAVIGYILTLILTVPWALMALVVGGLGLGAYLGYIILPPVLPVILTGIPFIGAFLVFITVVLTPSYFVYLGLGGGVLFMLLVFLGSIYFGIVRRINKGRYEKARNAALFFGVLFIIPTFFILFTTWLNGTIVAIIPAFFFLMAYGRLGEVIAKYGPVAVMGEAVPGAPFAGPPPVAPYPPHPAMGPPLAGAPPHGGMPGMGPGMAPHPGMVGPPPLTNVVPKIPLCPSCGRELYYSANHRRWYCMTCDNPTGHR